MQSIFKGYFERQVVCKCGVGRRAQFNITKFTRKEFTAHSKGLKRIIVKFTDHFSSEFFQKKIHGWLTVLFTCIGCRLIANWFRDITCNVWCLIVLHFIDSLICIHQQNPEVVTPLIDLLHQKRITMRIMHKKNTKMRKNERITWGSFLKNVCFWGKKLSTKKSFRYELTLLKHTQKYRSREKRSKQVSREPETGLNARKDFCWDEKFSFFSWSSFLSLLSYSLSLSLFQGVSSPEKEGESVTPPETLGDQLFPPGRWWFQKKELR